MKKNNPVSGQVVKDKKLSVNFNRKEKLPRSQEPSEIEVGGPKGLEPTRYGDWERKGRCVDF